MDKGNRNYFAVNLEIPWNLKWRSTVKSAEGLEADVPRRTIAYGQMGEIIRESEDSAESNKNIKKILEPQLGDEADYIGGGLPDVPDEAAYSIENDDHYAG